jgi:hypothetical protein
MHSRLRKELADQARFIAGSHAWFRPANDPAARRGLRNAKRFLAHIQGSIEEPHITGGTTSEPHNVLTLSWYVYSNVLASLEVVFKDDNMCSIIWNETRQTTRKLDGLSVDEVIAFDVPQKLRNLATVVSSEGESFEFLL